MGVDAQRKRIGLSMRLTDNAGDSFDDRGRARRSKFADGAGRPHGDKGSGCNGRRGKQSHKKSSTRRPQSEQSQPKEAKPESALALSLGAALAGKPKD